MSGAKEAPAGGKGAVVIWFVDAGATGAQTGKSWTDAFLDVSYTVFDSNIATSPNYAFLGGGGMYNFESSPSISNSVFSNNYCYPTLTLAPPYFGYGGGAGIFNISNSSPTISNSVFTYNFSLAGSGIFNANNSLPTITDTIFTGNYGIAGAGMFNRNSSSPTLTNVLFAENTAYYPSYGPRIGGGMANVYYSSPIISNATFSDNYAGWGGGIFNYYASNPVMSNTILWNNIGTSGDDEVNNARSGLSCNPVVTYSDIDQSGYAGTNGNTRNAPLFADSLFFPYFLSQSPAQGYSPCLDAGSDTAENLGMDDKTTSSLGAPDIGIVDMGFHLLIP